MQIQTYIDITYRENQDNHDYEVSDRLLEGCFLINFDPHSGMTLFEQAKAQAEHPDELISVAESTWTPGGEF